LPVLLFRVLLFLSSYAPLLGVLAYLNRSTRVAWVILVAIVVVAVAGLWLVFRSLSNDGPRSRSYALRGSVVDPVVVNALVSFRMRTAASPPQSLTTREHQILAELAPARATPPLPALW
jgi:hypothetical protein